VTGRGAPAGEISGLKLEETPEGLQLRAPGKGAPGPVRVDFGAPGMRRRRGGHNESLGRAVGSKARPGLHVVDATAGLGRDAFVLADLGCKVTLLERHPLAFALLEDGLRRARAGECDRLREVANRMELFRLDSRRWLAENPGVADVVYLDPMFPRRTKSARVKKEMWLFQQLMEADAPGDDLLSAAVNAARWRVVVKRPARAPALEGPRAHHAIPGRTVRFDVYDCD